MAPKNLPPPPMSKQGVQVEVEYRSVRYNYPQRLPLPNFQFVKDLTVMLMQALGLLSNSGRVPAVEDARRNYLIPGLPLAVVNVPKDMRPLLASALKVSS